MLYPTFLVLEGKGKDDKPPDFGAQYFQTNPLKGLVVFVCFGCIPRYFFQRSVWVETVVWEYFKGGEVHICSCVELILQGHTWITWTQCLVTHGTHGPRMSKMFVDVCWLQPWLDFLDEMIAAAQLHAVALVIPAVWWSLGKKSGSGMCHLPCRAHLGVWASTNWIPISPPLRMG